MEGYLELFLGPMFSGKTTQLIQIYNTYTYIGKKIFTINFIADVRYHDELLSSHDKIMIPCVFTRTLATVKETTDAADVILINEGQFFEDIYDTVLEMVEIYHKVVYICGLDGDFKRNKFGRLLDLVPYCDEIVKLSSLCAYCKNGTPGIFSHRISNETSQVVIGVDNYVPLCRNCYSKNT
jgi:thymidine kinase